MADTDPGLSFRAVDERSRPTHNADDAVAVARKVDTGTITRVAVAAVTDPTGIKLGLPTTRRTMWVVYSQDVYRPPTSGPAPAGPEPSAGAVIRSMTLIDDLTLKPGGRFSC